MFLEGSAIKSVADLFYCSSFSVDATVNVRGFLISPDVVANPRDRCVRLQWASITAVVGDLAPTRMLRLLAASVFAHDELNRQFEKTSRPLHGKSHEEMDSARRRV